MTKLWEILEDEDALGGRSGKARKIRTNGANASSGSGQNNTRDSSYNGLPQQAVFKVITSKDKATGKINSNTGYAMMKALDYLSQDNDELSQEDLEKKLANNEVMPEVGRLGLETDDGRILNTKQDVYNYYKEWNETATTRKDGKDFEHVLLSTSETPGTNDKEILDAARKILKEQYGNDGYNYAFTLHTDKEHTHVHAIIRVHNTHTKPFSTKLKPRLDIKKEDIWKTKLSFANELQSKGLDYVASVQFDRIKSLDHKLDYIKQYDMSWFNSNVEKLKEVDIDELGTKLKLLDKTIEENITKRKNLDVEIKKTKDIVMKEYLTSNKNKISTLINDLHVDKRATIKALNQYEYALQQATKNYQSLKLKQKKIPKILTFSKRAKELHVEVEEAYKLVVEKRMQIDKAQLYLSSTKENTTFSDNIKKSVLEYTQENINNANDINKVLYQINNLEKKLPKAEVTQEIKRLKEELLNEPLYKYQELGKIYIKNDLLAVTNNKNIYEKIAKNYSIYDYDLKAQGLNPNEYAYKKEEHISNSILLDHTDKDILKKYIENSSHDASAGFLKYINIQIENKSIIQEYQLNKLNIDKELLLSELGKSFTPVSYEKNIVDYAKTYIDKFNDGTIASIKYKDIDYKQGLEEIKDIDYNKLSFSNNKDTFIKLDAVREKAIENKDLEALDITYKNDAVIDRATTIKEYGKVLDIDIKQINKDIWLESGNDNNDFVGFGDKQVKQLEDYKEIFTEKYLQEIDMQYMFQKMDNLKSDDEYHLIENDIKEFSELINDFKNEIVENEANKQYLEQLKEVHEHLSSGNFKEATELIGTIEFKDEMDKRNLEANYSNAIDTFAKDEHLEAIELVIERQSELEHKSYEIMPEEIAPVNKKDLAAQIEVPIQKEKVAAVEIEKITPVIDEIKIASPGQIEKSSTLNYDEIKEQYDHKVIDFKQQVIKAFEEPIRKEQKSALNDKVFLNSKQLASELKRNIIQIESTKVSIEVLKNTEAHERKILSANLDDYIKNTKSLNNNAKEFINEVNKNTDLTDKQKNTISAGLHDELNKNNYSKRLVDNLPEYKEEMINRSINNMKVINKAIDIELKTQKPNKEAIDKLVDKGSKLLKNFSELKPSWKNERAITKLHSEQVKSLSKQRGLDR
ncbi:MAG: hypothetical protein DRG78_00790 [Epsilonproteobacteria bacterium]|nr:MAG: hypothetical protein DRG78_00790 [Campylobacterota bacterium]